jgi:hypothetical protein
MTPPPRLARAAAVAAAAVLAASATLGAQTPGAAASSGQAPPDPPAAQEHDHNLPPPGLFVRAFGSINWGVTNERDVPNSFALGQFALFATSTLSERVSVLAEVVLEASQTTEVVTDLERLQVNFRFDDRLHVSAGRYHTGIGYYNAAYHHAAYFETVIGRPRVFEFEDEGGVLPVHEVGLTGGGVVPGTGSLLHYLAEVGNGRSWIDKGAAVDEAPDTNDAKSTNLGISVHPPGLRGFEAGGSFYRDRTPRGPLAPVDQRITSAYAVYKTTSLELMGEWLRLWARSEDAGEFVNHGGYVQASRAWGRVRPYYRYDRLTVQPGTPLYGDRGAYSANIAGVRVDPAQWVSLKAQYERTNESRRQGIDGLRTQLVFVF